MAAELTLAQKKALALAAARKRLVEKQDAPTADRGVTQFDLMTKPKSAQQQYDEAPAWAKPLIAADDLVTLAASGISFGYADKAAAGIDSLLGRGSYDERLKYRRGKTQEARDRSGIPGIVAEVGGSVVPVARLAKAGITATNIPKVGKYLGVGLDGALFGGLNAAGNDQNIATGAATGAAFGWGGQLLGNAIGPLVRPLWSRINPYGAAQRVMADTMGSAKMTPNDVADQLARARADGQDVYAVADALGHPGQRLTSTIARTPNEGRTPMVEFLEKRQAGQGRRISNALSEGFGSPDTAAQRATTLTTARDAAADANYTAARAAAQDVNPQPAIDAIDNILGGGRVKQATGVSPDSIEGALLGIRSRLTSNDNNAIVTGFDEILRLSQDVGDAIGAAVRAGAGNKARLLGKVKDQLETALEAASSPYANARNKFRVASKAIDAIDTGKQAAMRGRFEDTIPRFNAMSAAEQNAFRAGYADPLIAQTQQAATGVNKARPLINDAFEREFPAFADIGQGRRLGNRIAREQTMFETRNTALGGSKTADNLADEAGLSAIDPSVIGNVLTGNWTGAAKNALLQGISALKGQPPSVRQRLSEALRQTDPNVARQMLNSAVSSLKASQAQKQAIIRAMMLLGTASTAQAQK